MMKSLTLAIVSVSLLTACTGPDTREPTSVPVPSRVIDLTPTITADQPERIWGRRMLTDFGFRLTNDFEFVINRDFLYSSNSYWTLFNHTGAHLDAPSHMIDGARTVDSIPLQQLIGRGRVLDFRAKARDEEISVDEVRQTDVQPGEIALLLVAFDTPVGPDALPAYAALSPEAAEYLAGLPVQAIGTSGFSVESVARMYEVIDDGVRGNEGVTPVHNAFLTRDVPVFEALTNLEALVEVDSFVFVGLPLKVEGSDGSPIRAAALVYD